MGLAIAGSLLLLTGVAAFLVRRYNSIAGLTVDEGKVCFRDVRSERTWAVSDVSALIGVRVKPRGLGMSVQRRILLIGKGGAALLGLSTARWKVEDLERIAETLGIPFRDAGQDVRSASDLDAAYPGSATWLDLHGSATALWGTVVFCFSIGALIALLGRIWSHG